MGGEDIVPLHEEGHMNAHLEALSDVSAALVIHGLFYGGDAEPDPVALDRLCDLANKPTLFEEIRLRAAIGALAGAAEILRGAHAALLDGRSADVDAVHLARCIVHAAGA